MLFSFLGDIINVSFRHYASLICPNPQFSNNKKENNILWKESVDRSDKVRQAMAPTADGRRVLNNLVVNSQWRRSLLGDCFPGKREPAGRTRKRVKLEMAASEEEVDEMVQTNFKYKSVGHTVGIIHRQFLVCFNQVFFLQTNLAYSFFSLGLMPYNHIQNSVYK